MPCGPPILIPRATSCHSLVQVAQPRPPALRRPTFRLITCRQMQIRLRKAALPPVARSSPLLRRPEPRPPPIPPCLRPVLLRRKNHSAFPPLTRPRPLLRPVASSRRPAWLSTAATFNPPPDLPSRLRLSTSQTPPSH